MPRADRADTNSHHIHTRPEYSQAYLSKHVADESSFVCDGGRIECRMDIHVRRMARISDMNVQATGIAAMDRVSGTRPVSISHSGFGHSALNFHGRMPRLRFDRMSSSESLLGERQISGYRRKPGSSALRLIKSAATRQRPVVRLGSS